MREILKLLLSLVILQGIRADDLESPATLAVSDKEVSLELGQDTIVQYCVQGEIENPTNLTFLMPSKEVLDYAGNTSIILTIDDSNWCSNLTFGTLKEGIVTLKTSSNDSDSIDASDAFVIFSVMKDPGIDTAASVLGWISTIAWDFSFIPQIWHNYRRNSVVGLSFDFLTLNFLGFSCYLMFNAGLFWNQAVQDQFTIRHPDEVLHVRLNDVIFPLYAVICTAIQIVQCFFYKRAPGQTVSIPCRVISGVLILLVIIGCILVPSLEDYLWIDVLYLMSYVKLFISMIKYTPQLYINFKTKSTAGWSIGQVLLDFTGGLSSLIQMFLIGANYDDIKSILTDPTKLGLALLSMFFNVFFMIQHFILYRNNNHESKEGETNSAYKDTELDVGDATDVPKVDTK